MFMTLIENFISFFKKKKYSNFNIVQTILHFLFEI